MLRVVCFESGSVLESLASCYVPVAACLPGRAHPSPSWTLPHPAPFLEHLYPTPNVGKCGNRSKSSNPGNCSTAPSSHIPAMGLMRDTPHPCSLSFSQSISAVQEFLLPWWGLRAHWLPLTVPAWSQLPLCLRDNRYGCIHLEGGSVLWFNFPGCKTNKP